jgi:predicted DNA-binding protein
MTYPTSNTIYSRFVGFRAPQEMSDRLDRFSLALGRHKSDVIRYILGRSLTAYETDTAVIARIKQEMY